jgi:hypothetical protein
MCDAAPAAEMSLLEPGPRRPSSGSVGAGDRLILENRGAAMGTVAQQVLPGLCNDLPGALAVATPFGFNVISYGSGSHVVLVLAGAQPLTLQETRVDVDAVACIAWAADGTRFVVGGKGRIFLFEPAPISGTHAAAACPYKWKVTAALKPPEHVFALAWAEGHGESEMLLSAGTEIGLWRLGPPRARELTALEECEMGEEDAEAEAAREAEARRWERRLDAYVAVEDDACVWRTVAHVPACLASCSLDGKVMATCGQSETRIKAWFRNEYAGELLKAEGLQYDFQYLSHPAPVVGLSWSRGKGRNALLTVCADGLLRIWMCASQDAAVSFFAAATWPQGDAGLSLPAPSAASDAATWLTMPAVGFELALQRAQRGEEVECPLGLVPEVGGDQCEWVAHHSCGGGTLSLWRVEGLATRATQRSLRVSGPVTVVTTPPSLASPREVGGGAGGAGSALRGLHTLAVQGAMLDPLQESELPVLGAFVGHGVDGRVHVWEAALRSTDAAMDPVASCHVVGAAYTPIGVDPVAMLSLSSDGRHAVALTSSTSSSELTLWQLVDPMLHFAAPRAAPLSRCSSCPVDGLVHAVSWLPHATVLATGGPGGWSLFSADGGAMVELTCSDGESETSAGACTALCAFPGGSELRWFLTGLVQTAGGANKSLIVWDVTVSGASFGVQRVSCEELPPGSGTAMCGAPVSADVSVHGKLAAVAQNDKVDATKGPMAMFVGAEDGGVTVYALLQGGAAVEEETEEMLIERAVAHFPEPKRTALKGSLLKMPAGAREKAIEKFLASAPGGGAAPAPEPAPASAGGGGGGGAEAYRLEAVSTLRQDGGAVTHLAAHNANRIAAVTADSGGSSRLFLWTAEPASWPDFHVRHVVKREDEVVLSIGWNVAAHDGGLAVAIALRDRVDVIGLASDLDWTTGDESWKLVETIDEPMQPVTCVMWFAGRGLVVASEHHMQAYFSVGAGSQSGVQLVPPDYHPDMLEGLLFAGDDAREMLGRIARNAVSTAPEEWEAQKWRPPRTQVHELLGTKDAAAAQSAAVDDEASRSAGLFSVMALDDSSGPADPMDRDAARKLAEKLRARAQLLGISVDQRAHLAVIMETHAEEIYGSLDANAMRFLLRVIYVRKLKELSASGKLQKPVGERQLSAADRVWAFHSETQEAMLQAAFPAQTTLDELLQAGVPLWIRNPKELERVVMKVAIAEFKKSKDPDDCLLLYVALKKKQMAIALYKSVQNVKLVQFLANDFAQQRWCTAAKKNGFALLKKGKFHMAAAFLLLGSDLAMAVTVLIKNARSPELALLVIRLFEGDRSKQYPVALKKHVLGPAIEAGDGFTASIVHWLNEDYQDALGVLCQQSSDVADDSEESGPRGAPAEAAPPQKADAAQAWEVMKYISNRPVLKRAGLSNEQYTRMIKVAVAAALGHAQSGQLLLGLQLLDSLVAWDRYHMISRPEINVHFTLSIMQALAVAALRNLVQDAIARKAATTYGVDSKEQLHEAECTLLQPARILADTFGLSLGALVGGLRYDMLSQLQFGLHREIVAAKDCEAVAVDESEIWSIVQALGTAATVRSSRPGPGSGYRQRLSALHSCVYDVVRAVPDAVPQKLLGAVALVGRFATAWHAQDYADLLPQFFPGQAGLEPSGAAVAAPRVRSVSTGHVLLLLLARLGFALDLRLRIRPSHEGSTPPKVAALCEELRRRVWCWFFQVKAALHPAAVAVVAAAVAAGTVEQFPPVPEEPRQARAAALLWEELLDEERAGHRVTTETGAAAALDPILYPGGTEGGGGRQLFPQELYRYAGWCPGWLAWDPVARDAD